MEPTTSNTLICEACNITIHKNNYEGHLNGRKHILKQDTFDKTHKAVFVSGVSKLTPEDLKRIFQKYGEVKEIIKQRHQAFAFVQFVDKSSVEEVLKARICVGQSLLFVYKYKSRNCPSIQHAKSRKHSDSSPNISQPQLAPGQVGVEELPVELPDPDQCPDLKTVFDWQVKQFISQVELPADMYQNLNQVTADIEDVFCNQLPGCKVIVFGSCGSTLAFKNSDVDLFIQCVGDQPKEFVKKYGRLLYRSRLVNIIARIPSARVPIVKFVHLKTGWQCDLTAHSKLGVCNSRLIRFLISLDPRIKPLVMVVKYWAKVCGVTGSHQNLTTYSLVMLVIFYLQQLSPPIVPPVATLQRLADHHEFSSGWECSFCDKDWKVKFEWPTEENKKTLKELLIGFFHFYDTFDFNNVVCPLLGHTVPVSDFEDPEKLPKEMQLYNDNLKSDPTLEFKRNVMLRVQDPFELCLNITKNVSDKGFFILKNACTASCQLGNINDDVSLLKSLFSIEKESLDVDDDCFKTHIPFENDPTLSESDISQWYELTTEAIMLVMREVLKLNIEPNNVEVSSKVKKLDSSQDVHTLPNSFNSSDHLNYTCSGHSSVWSSRKKSSKLLKSLNIYLSDFEKEVCISNILHKPEKNCGFSFNLVMSSFDQFKTTTKGVDIIVKYKKSQAKSQAKELMHYLKFYFKFHIKQALEFIKKTKESSSVAEVKESLKELFDLAQTKPPVLSTDSDELQDKEDLELTEQKNDGILTQQSLLLQSIMREAPINEAQNRSSFSNKVGEQQSLLLQRVTKEDAIHRKQNESDIISNKVSEQQSLLLQRVTKEDAIHRKQNKSDIIYNKDIEQHSFLMQSTSPIYKMVSEQQSLTSENVTTESPKNEKIGSISKKISEVGKSLDEIVKPVSSKASEAPLNFVNNLETQGGRNSNLIAGNVVNDKTQEMIDDFLKGNNPDQMNMVNFNECLNSTDSVFCNMLTNLKKCETESSFTSGKGNPFLEILEKVTNVQPMSIQNELDVCNNPKQVIKKQNEAVGKTSNNELKLSVHPSKNEIVNSELFDTSLSKKCIEEDGKSNTKLIAPKVYVERPHNFRKPNNHKPSYPITQKPLVESDRLCEGPHKHKRFSRGPDPARSSSDYRYYKEYVDSRYNYNELYTSDTYQLQLSRSVERQKMWYPTLFKHN